MIQAVLGNPSHPEYGVATIPFPIPHNQYAHCMELLEALEVGDAVKADCRVEKIDSFYTVLKRTEMRTVNVEELNYLAKRLDSFDTGEAAQFQAMAHKLELFELKDLIKRSIQMAQDKLLELTDQMEQQACPDVEIERWMRELSRQLSETPGKHVYGYLPKPTKELVEQIVDRLAQLPEVAACYEQWNMVKDELVRFHNQNPRQRLPLSQQKEFRVLLNAVIRESERIRLTEEAVVKTIEQILPPRPIAAAEQSQDIPKAQNVNILPATLRLLHHLGNIFRHDALISPTTLRIDSKRRRRLQEKRMAMGHKRDDHEEAQRQEQLLP